MLFVALALLPALALQAAPAPTTKKTAILLVPMDKGSEAEVVRLESYMLEALQEFPSAVVKKTDELLGLPADEDAAAALKRAEAGYKEARAAYEAREFEDAERKLRADIKEFHKAAAALKACGDLCDAMAMYAAVLQQRGDAEEAKLQLIDLLALSPAFEFDPKRYAHDFLLLRMQVATGHQAAMRGSVTVKTKPAGARIYVDGEFSGFSPVTLSTLQIGQHILRVERPGFKVHGEMLELTPEDTEQVVELKQTAQFKAYDGVLDKVAGEINRDQGGATIAGLGKTLSLDRGLVGTVKELNDSGATELVVGLYDLRSGHRLAGKKAVFQGDEFGQLKSELGRVVNALMNSADGPQEKASKTADPLKGVHGTEDWGSEDRGGKGTTQKKKSHDPLEGMNGMEDW